MGIECGDTASDDIGSYSESLREIYKDQKRIARSDELILLHMTLFICEPTKYAKKFEQTLKYWSHNLKTGRNSNKKQYQAYS